jgi:hypothetical protein
MGAFLVAAATGCGDREKPAPRVEITTPQGPRSGDVVITYVLYDTDSYPANIKVQYSIDGGTRYSLATEAPGGDGVSLLTTNQRGIAHSFVWDSVADVGYVNESNARIVITATSRTVGLPSYTGNFILENYVLGEWEPNARVDDDPGISSANAPRLAVLGNSVYAVWTDARSGNTDIFFAYSSDAGTTWETPVQVNNDAGTAAQRNPGIACDPAGDVYVVWEDERGGDSSIYMSVGNNPGSGYTFPTNSKVSSASAISAEEPVIAAYGLATALRVCVAWTDERNGDPDIYFRHSVDSAASWEAEQLISDDATSADQYEPSICADGAGGVYVAWTDRRNGNPDIYAAAGTEAAPDINFSANVRVDDDAGTAHATEPSVTAYGSNVYVAYTDQRSRNQDIYVATSVDSAATFATNLQASDDPNNLAQFEPSITVNSSTGEVYLVFSDRRSDGPSIYFTSSTQPGVSFEANERIDDDSGTSNQGEPWVVHGSRVFVIFVDNRNGNSDIFFTRRPKD